MCLTVPKKILMLFCRPGTLIAELCCGMKRPIRIRQMGAGEADSVSYTHLTLPTMLWV